jgi:hypothetical protein
MDQGKIEEVISRYRARSKKLEARREQPDPVKRDAEVVVIVSLPTGQAGVSNHERRKHFFFINLLTRIRQSNGGVFIVPRWRGKWFNHNEPF